MSSLATQMFSILPSLAVGIALVAALWWGHHHDWVAPSRDRLVYGPPPPSAEHWCAEHSLPEANCLLCRKELAKTTIAAEPAWYRAEGEEVRFAQGASADALARLGLTTGIAAETTAAPELTVSAVSRFDPARLVRLTARTAGSVRAIPAHLGDRMETGAILVVLDCAAVGEAKAGLLRAVVDLDSARTTAARTSGAAGVLPAAELETTAVRVRAATVAVLSAEQALANLGFIDAIGLATELAPLSARDPVAAMTHLRRLGLPDGFADDGSANLLPVRSPRAGLVVAVHTALGETVSADAPLAEVVEPAAIQVIAQMSPNAVSTVAVGQQASFRVAERAEPVTARVSAIAAIADPTTRLVAVHLDVTGSEKAAGVTLGAGRIGTATILLGPPQPAALIPIAAVQWDGATAYVFIRRSAETFRALPVPVLARWPDGLVVGRLRPGDVIATAGTGALKASLFQDRFGPGCACGGK